MPELPEVETVVRSLAPHLPGRTIITAEFGSKHVTPGNRSELAKKLAGRRIQSVTRRGKHILVALDAGTLVVHLGMTGQLLLDTTPSNHAYGIFHLDTGMLVYRDPRQFGSIAWHRNLDTLFAKLGPEPLTV